VLFREPEGPDSIPDVAIKMRGRKEGITSLQHN
jgi:hypothetical protein